MIRDLTYHVVETVVTSSILAHKTARLGEIVEKQVPTTARLDRITTGTPTTTTASSQFVNNRTTEDQAKTKAADSLKSKRQDQDQGSYDKLC